jgi:aminoglycoside 6'-N-acetyltransferase I
MQIQPVKPADQADWQRMRTAMWPDTDDEHASSITAFFAGELFEPLAVLIARDNNEQALGFIELNIRNYAEDCWSNNVGYVEGWYVETHARLQGVGRALFEAAEAWARAQGCTEMASDTWLENDISRLAHLALGYEETARIICFRKEL